MTSFHTVLDVLDDRFTAAGLLVVEQMPRLVEGYLRGDKAVLEPCRLMAADVAAECRAVEDTGFLLLARHQPVAVDLRRLVSLLRMCVDVDRSAALLRHVCETLRVVDPREFPEDLRTQVRELAERSAGVFRGGLDAWRAKDALAVNELDEDDEGVDRLQRVLLDTATEQAEAPEQRLMIGLIARYLERIADHGVAIARDTAFTATGERVELPSKTVG
jgi:phosphate transport system protein